MRRFDFRIVLGLILLLGGGLLLLQNMGYLRNASDFFWGAVFVIAGAAFLSLLFGGSGNWWALFPGMTLLAIGAVILLGERSGRFDGMIVLGGIALAVWLVYFMDRVRWWALIPAGVLTTLAIVTVVPDRAGDSATAGVFFLGLAFTFLLVALAAGARWAYYPAGALAVVGALATVSSTSVVNYLWAVVLIAIGGYLVFRFFTNR